MLYYTYRYVDGGWKLTEANKMSGIDEKNGWSIPHWAANYDSDWTEWHQERVYSCQHKWIDTGMRKTFCKECDAEGDYDPMTGRVTLVERPVKKEEKK